MSKKQHALRHLPGAVCLGGGLLVYLFAMLMAGGSPVHLILFWAAFCVGVLGSGLFFVRKLLPQAAGLDQLPLAFLPGCAALWAGYVLVGLIPGVDSLGWLHLLPALLLGGYELIYRLRNSLPGCPLKDRLSPLAWNLLTVTMGGTLALYALWGVLFYAHADRLKAWVYNQDMLWSIGNAASMRFGMPLTDIRAAGLTLNYHFFNDGIAGILAWGTGCPAWDGLCFYWYPPVLLLSILALGCAGRRMLPAGAAQPLAFCVAPVIYLCNPANSTMATNLFTNANAQGTALLALSSLLLVAANPPAKQQRFGAAAYGLFGLLSFAAALMIKSPAGALACLGLAAACAVGLLTKQTHAAHGTALVGAAAAFGLVYWLVLSRATNNLIFTTLANLTQLPQTYLLYVALPVLLLYLIGLGYSLLHFTQLSVMQLMANALAVGGMLAYVLFNHYSFSQVYFALTAVPCLILSVLPAVQALGDRLQGKKLRLAAAAAAVAFCCCAAVQLWGNQGALRSGVQALLRCANLRESEATELTCTDEDWNAAVWLRENTSADAIFLSNRNNKQFNAADGIFHFYSAVSQRQCYLESYRYGMDYDGAYWEIRRRLEDVSDAIYYRLAEDEAFTLAAAEGIDYIVVNRLVPNAPQWQRTPVYENQYVSIYEVSRN